MKIETVEYLWPSEGKWLTDGKEYYSAVKLGEGRSAEEFCEITEEEYAEIVAKNEAEIKTGLNKTTSEEDTAIVPEEHQEEETNGNNN